MEFFAPRFAGRGILRLQIGFVVLWTAIAGSPVRAQTPQQSRLEEHAQARVYRLRLRIEPTWVAQPGECLNLTASDLRVSLRGKRIADPAMLRLDRELEPTVHALMIDTSGSMVGRLEQARQAAIRYVRRLRPEHERALVVSFAESVLLHHGVTADRERLVAAIENVRMSSATAMLDALVYTIREVSVHRDRPVLLLLSDGMDTGSLHERGDVFERIAGRPDLTIFTIGLGLPTLSTTGPPGLASTKKFLQQIASRTSGAFFDVPTPSRLDAAYKRIRELLDNEATLSVIDADPGIEPGNVRVGAKGEGCRVRVIGAADEAGAEEIQADAKARTFEIRPDEVLVDPFRVLRVEAMDSVCGGPLPAAGGPAPGMPWRLTVQDGRVRGCALDVTMDYGPLYDPFPSEWISGNEWLRLRTRPLEIVVPPIGELPDRPEKILDALALHALSVAGTEIETDPRRQPPGEHARPYHDYPGLAHARTFFDLRPSLARALYTHDDYRAWTLDRRRAEADREIEYFEARLRRLSPGSTDEELQAVLLVSDEARRILDRAARPSIEDVERHLAAWLGDLPAHDLFVRWEARRVVDLLRGATPNYEFLDAWVELRRIFFLPSYTRMLTLLAPGRDPRVDRIGFWRVILPRLGWLKERVKGNERHPDFSDLPLDLVPDLPLGFWIVRTIAGSDPEVAAALRSQRYTTGVVTYELLGKAKKHDPLRGFRRTHITVELGEGPEAPPSKLRIDAEVGLEYERERTVPRIERLQITAADPDLARLLARAGRSLVGSRPQRR